MRFARSDTSDTDQTNPQSTGGWNTGTNGYFHNVNEFEQINVRSDPYVATADKLVEVGIWGVFQTCHFDTIATEQINRDGSDNVVAPVGVGGIGIWIQNSRAYTGVSIYDRYGCQCNLLQSLYTEMTRTPIVTEQAGLSIGSAFSYGDISATPIYEQRYKFTKNSLIQANDCLCMADGSYQYNLVVDDSTAYINSSMLSGTSTVAPKNYLNNYQVYTNINDLNGSTSMINATITSTTNATDISTGSMQISGGASVKKDVYVGGNLKVTGTVSGSYGTEESTSVNSGAVVVGGGVGIGKNLNVGGDVTLSPTKTVTADHFVFKYGSITNTTQASDIYTGAFYLGGGAGIQKNLFVGGNLNVTGTDTFTNATQSTSTDTGAVILSGGLGVAKKVNANSIKLWNTTMATSADTGCLTTLGGVGIGDGLHVTNAVNCNSTDNATSISTGSIISKGGIGIAKDAFIGGDVTLASTKTINADHFVFKYGSITNTTEATDLYSGTFYVGGGAGIAKNVFIGGNLNVSGSITGSIPVPAYGTAESTSTDSGALQLLGGLGVAKKVNAMSIKLWSTDLATDVNTGSIVTLGGVGIGDGLHVKNTVNCNSTDNSSSASTGSLIVKGGAFITKNLLVGTSGSDSNLQVDRIIARYGSYSNTTEATSAYSGAFFVAGGMGVGKNLYSNGTLGLTGTIESTSTNSGIAIITGGVGIAKNLNVGGNLNVSGSITGSIPAPSYGTAESSSTDSGAFQLLGGAGIAKSLYVGGVLHVEDVTEATDINTGAVHVKGGMSIEKKLYTYRFRCNENATIGQDITVIGDINNSGTLFQNNTNTATSISSGAVQLLGGVSIAKDVFTGGTLNVISTTASTDSQSGCLKLSGGCGILGALNVNGQIQTNSGLGVIGNSAFLQGDIIQYNTTDTLNLTTGALQVKGGSAITKNLYVGGDVKILSTTDSTDYQSGSLVLNGGMGVTGNTYIWNELHVDSDFYCNGTINGSFATKHLYYYLNGDTAVASSNLIPFYLHTANDTMTGYDNSTYIFTPPYEGYYSVSVNLQIKTMNQGTYIIVIFSNDNYNLQDSMTMAQQQPIISASYPLTFNCNTYLTTSNTLRFKIYYDDTGITFYGNSGVHIIFNG